MQYSLPIKPKKRKPNTAFLKSFENINFGAGYDRKEGYLNVDVDPACEPDLLIVDDDYSVIPHDHYREIYAKDVLEHIPRAQTLSALLDWSNYLKPKGKLYVETTSILGVAEQIKKHHAFADQYGWQICLYGNQVHPGDFHHTGFTDVLLKVNLLAAGFEIDSLELKDKWLFHIYCHKATDWKKVIQKTADKDNGYFTQAVFNDVFGRDPDEVGGAHILGGLNSGKLTREAATKHLYSSPERLYYTAKLHKL